MIQNWPITNIAAAPLHIIDGDRGKNYPKHADFGDAGNCLFLNTGNVTKQGFNFDQCQFITEEKDSALRKGKLQRGDVIMTTRGTIGNVAHYSAAVPFEHVRINSGMVIFRTNREALLDRFLFQCIRSGSFRKQIESLRTGAAQPQLPIRDIKTIRVPIPAITTQRRIADNLSVYDDLIENNRRRIALLEQAARELYREWFVRLRFPGHENTRIVDGLPAGWERKTLREVAVTNAQSYHAKELPETLNYIDISSVSAGRILESKSMVAADAPGRARRKAVHGDVIWSNVRPNLKAYSLVLYPEENDVFSTGFSVLSTTRVPFTFLYQSVTSDYFVTYLVNHTTGVSYPAVRPDDFERAEIIVPAPLLLTKFHEICESKYYLIAKLVREDKQLMKARDLLLPRLMSGKVAV